LPLHASQTLLCAAAPTADKASLTLLCLRYGLKVAQQHLPSGLYRSCREPASIIHTHKIASVYLRRGRDFRSAFSGTWSRSVVASQWRDGRTAAFGPFAEREGFEPSIEVLAPITV